MIRLGSRYFAGVVTPQGIELIEYHRGIRELRIEQHLPDRGSIGSGAEVASRLGELLGRMAPGGGRVALAIDGFGSYFQTMTLPAASPEVLRPVVAREIRSAVPELPNALFGFGRTSLAAEAAGPPTTRSERELSLLVGVLPRDLVGLLNETLASRGFILEHVTIVPRALQRLHRAYAGSEEAVAMIACMPERPLLGFFTREGLQLFNTVLLASGEERESVLIEQVQRGRAFIRQRFRGELISRVLILGEVPGLNSRAALEAHGSVEVAGIGPEGVDAGAMLALGVALDARAGGSFDLLPAEMKPPGEPPAWLMQLTLLGATLLMIAGIWWAGSALRLTHQMGARVDAAAAEVLQLDQAVQPLRSVAEERRAHAERLSLFDAVLDSHGALRMIVNGISATPPAVRLEAAQLKLEGERWVGEIGGRASSRTPAGSARILEDWYGTFLRPFPPGAVQLVELSGMEGMESSGTGLDFRLLLDLPVHAGGE